MILPPSGGYIVAVNPKPTAIASPSKPPAPSLIPDGNTPAAENPSPAQTHEVPTGTQVSQLPEMTEKPVDTGSASGGQPPQTPGSQHPAGVNIDTQKENPKTGDRFEASLSLMSAIAALGGIMVLERLLRQRGND